MSTERIPWWEALADRRLIAWPGVVLTRESGRRRPAMVRSHGASGMLQLRSDVVAGDDAYAYPVDPDGTVEVLIEPQSEPVSDVVQQVADEIQSSYWGSDADSWRPEAEAAIAAYREALGCGDDDVLVPIPRAWAMASHDKHVGPLVDIVRSLSSALNAAVRRNCATALEREGGA